MNRTALGRNDGDLVGTALGVKVGLVDGAYVWKYIEMLKL